MFEESRTRPSSETATMSVKNSDSASVADQILVENLCAVVSSYKEIIRSLDQEIFCRETPEHSSAGKHIRHIIDRSRCLLDGIGTGFVDYDDRERSADIEHSTALCILALERIVQDIHSLPGGYQHYPLLISETVSESGCKPTVPSTVGRELLDIINHSTHHLAIIKLILNSLGVRTEADMGKTPSTILFERRQKSV